MGRALVIGCGGTLGFAWTAAVLAELERSGWSPGDADVIVGTSAGAEAAALLGAGIPASAILASLTGAPGGDPRVRRHLEADDAPGRLPGVPFPTLPSLGLGLSAARGRTDLLAGLAGLLPRGSGDAGWLRRLGSDLADSSGWVPHRNTWLVAADTSTGERVPFGAPGAPNASLGDALAASWAIPGWFPPVDVGGRRFLDGGTVSPTSADLLLPSVRLGRIDEVVIVAPMSSLGSARARGLSRVERLLRRSMTRRLSREVHELRVAGAEVRRLEPSGRDLAAMGANFMDGRRRHTVLAQARHNAPAIVASRNGTMVAQVSEHQ